jgi:two-component sensor histidine kinase
MALSMVHEQLYKYSELSAVDIGKYLATLVRAIQQGAANPLYPPVLELDCARRELPMDSVVPLGLIVNEALINAFKHNAHQERPLHIRLSFRMENERFILELRDDGVGLPEQEGLAFDARTKGENLGMTLIALLAGQLGGSVAYGQADGWTSFTLDFPADQNNSQTAKPA